MKNKKQKLLKIEKEDFALIVQKAEKYTAGNISAWMIYASMMHEPSKEELIASQGD